MFKIVEDETKITKGIWTSYYGTYTVYLCLVPVFRHLTLIKRVMK